MLVKRNAVLTASLIVLVLSFSFLAIASSQAANVCMPTIRNVDDTKQLMFSVPFIFGAGYHENTRLLNQSTRMEIYNFVKNNPGIHFRGICNSLGLSIGVAQYHLDLLTSAGLLSVYNDGRCKRFFESKIFTETDMKTISLLRHDTTRKILTDLLQSDSVFHKDLARRLGISSQALTWQMNRLRKTGLIEAVKEGMSVKYLLNEENAILLKQYLSLIG